MNFLGKFKNCYIFFFCLIGEYKFFVIHEFPHKRDVVLIITAAGAPDTLAASFRKFFIMRTQSLSTPKDVNMTRLDWNRL